MCYSFFFFLFILFLLWDRASQWSPGWIGTHSADRAGLNSEIHLPLPLECWDKGMHYHFCVIPFSCAVLGIASMFSHILGTCSTTELASVRFSLRQSLVRLPRLALNFWFSHLCLQSSSVEHLCEIILIIFIFPLRWGHTQLSRQVWNLVIFLPLPDKC